MDLKIDLPARNDRFGYHGGLALLGTALPTLAVHDDLGWHLDPFVDLGESFYSIVGDYRVTLNVPGGARHADDGHRRRLESTPAPSTRVTTYVATDVRDFEWAAGRLPTRPRPLGRHAGRRRATGRSDLTRRAARTALERSIQSLDSYSASLRHVPVPGDGRRPRRASARSAAWSTRRSSSRTPARSRSRTSWRISTGTGSWATTSSRRPWLDESFATWTQYLPFGAWKKLRRTIGSDVAGAGITNDMALLDRASEPVRHDLRRRRLPARQPRGPVRHRRASSASCTTTRHDHWLGVARTEDFKAAIEAAAAERPAGARHGRLLGHWRVD